MTEHITIIGAGLSGLSAAIRLAELGVSCALVSLQPSERAQSVLAEGGINAALDTMGEGDTPAEHFADTMRGGADLADPNAVAGLTGNAPELVRRLYALGAPLQAERGRLILRNFGGQKKKRTAYAKSSTGKVLMTALIDEARRYEAAGLIRRFSHHELTGLSVDCGRCTGAVVRDSHTGRGLRFPGPVLLCCGGPGGLFPGMTTGTTANSGTAAALAFAAGAALGNPEMIQYHPTTVQIPNKRMLISEAARGEGGRLFVRRGSENWYFMEELYPALGNLMPRDVVSREMVRVCALPECGGQVFLDMTGLPKDTWRRKLPDLRAEVEHYLALDPAKQPIPVSPGIHYFMGGLLVDEAHRTTVPDLFAAGECACQYHGANRLGGNSMLGAIYGGRVAAEAAAPHAVGGEPAALGSQPSETVTAAFAATLGDVLLSGLGILREETGLTQALARLDALAALERSEADRRQRLLGRAMLLAALARQESRGAHTRTDFPERNDARFQKTTVARFRDGGIDITFQAIPERRAVL